MVRRNLGLPHRLISKNFNCVIWVKNKDFIGSGLNIVRDIFIFSCYTGLAYIDIFNLTKEQITIGVDGNLWIITNRQKTGINSNIPLLPIAEEIIKKYENHPLVSNSGKLLPVFYILNNFFYYKIILK